ncbi:hypothetical protein Vadar_019024 [Vaccinium darrowii]|uniref:Uncharacterized protein n=1 Tax=Vaccinium darrowii TaxID=229202 RepID=A0ACB7Y905_9ERIC|nr:hypothetical protein Vadar_019024 [Vaccinium darrowii]
MVPEKVLSADSAAQLRQGIDLVLSRWSALQMAVVSEWGGRDSLLKSHQLAVDIFSWFTQSREQLYIDDLEDMLDESMLSLNTEIDDGSVEEIAEKLMIMHEECLEGQPEGMNSDDDDDVDEDNNRRAENDDLSGMVVDAPNFQSNQNHRDVMVDRARPSEAAVAEDGWTVVAPRRNRGTRN